MITRWHRALVLSLGLLAACETSPPPPPAIRFTVPVPEDRVLSSFAVSSDGARIAYSVALSIPFIGPWVASLIFGGEFPTLALISRFPQGISDALLSQILAKLSQPSREDVQ